MCPQIGLHLRNWTVQSLSQRNGLFSKILINEKLKIPAGHTSVSWKSINLTNQLSNPISSDLIAFSCFVELIILADLYLTVDLLNRKLIRNLVIRNQGNIEIQNNQRPMSCDHLLRMLKTFSQQSRQHRFKISNHFIDHNQS